MTLPEKVKDLTQTEWLEVRERLAEAASDAEAADMYAARSLRFSEQADQLASQLALAMTWGAEVCVALRKTRTMLDEVEGRAYGDDAYIIGLEAELDKLKKGAKLASAIVANNATAAELLERAERAEAERDTLRAVRDALRAQKAAQDDSWLAMKHERDDARERAQGAECEVQSWKDECGRWEERTADVEARLLAVTAERDEARACWHRDVAKGRAAIEKREADLADARRHLAAVVAALGSTAEELGRWTVDHDGDEATSIDAYGVSVLVRLETAARAVLADAEPAARAHDEAVRAEARAELDQTRAQLDSLLAKVTWMLTAPDFDRAAVERRVGLVPMTELHAIADAYIERVRAEERERCAAIVACGDEHRSGCLACIRGRQLRALGGRRG